MTDGWLVVIDPQNIFASPDSEWGSPFFEEAMQNIRRLAARFGERVLVTRWMPTADRSTSWGEYFAAWPFADQPPTDRLFDLVPAAASVSGYCSRNFSICPWTDFGENFPPETFCFNVWRALAALSSFLTPSSPLSSLRSVPTVAGSVYPLKRVESSVRVL